MSGGSLFKDHFPDEEVIPISQDMDRADTERSFSLRTLIRPSLKKQQYSIKAYKNPISITTNPKDRTEEVYVKCLAKQTRL